MPDPALTISQRVLIAVASGCVNTRQVAEYLDVPHSTVMNLFYESRYYPSGKFINGDVLQWDSGRANTLRLGPNAAVVRDTASDKVLAVGRAEKIEQWKNGG